MGMNISSRVIYGLPYDEFEDKERIQIHLDEDELSYASAHYDSSMSDWTVGVRMPSEYCTPEEFAEAFKGAAKEFFELAGCTGRVIIGQHVT